MRWVGLVSLALVACHADLRLPPQPWRPDQRVAAYNQLAATHERVYTSGNGASSRTLIIGDGREIRYPEDLRPVVPPDSPTGRMARRAAEVGPKSRWLLVGGAASAFAGFVFTAHAEFADGDTGIVGPVLLAGGLVALGVGLYYHVVYSHATNNAYETYDDDLAAALHVCASGLAVVPCEDAQQPASPQPQGNGGYYGTTPQPTGN